jgi:outer membrane murein-binding lipoprotein Lpp
MKKKLFYVLVILILAAFSSSIILAGCASSKASESGAPLSKEANTVQDASKVVEAAQTTAAGTAQGEQAAQQDQNQSGSNLPVIQPKIIKSAAASIEVAKGTFEENMVKVTKIAELMGGYVSNTESYSDADGKLTSGRIVIRVPGEKFNTAIDEIKKAGELKSISISGQDVTQEYVDLGSRLKNFEAQEKVLLDLMNKSTNVKDSIEVQKELSNVQGEMEVIKGRMNYLDNMVGFSTIDVIVAEPAVAPPVQGGGFVNAIKRGAEGAIKVLNGLAFFLVAISPILALAGIVLLIVWGSIRSRNKKRAKRAAEAAILAQTARTVEKKE